MRYLFFLLLLASCSPLYIPNTRNVPLFREQGEAQISGYLTSGGVEAQGAYAVTDHVAITGNIAYGQARRTNPDYDRKNAFGEIGIGYFDRTRSVRYEIFGGYGMGQGTSLDQYYFFGLNNTVVATGKMSRVFFQPSIGTNNRSVNFSFTPRLSWVNFSEFSTSTKTVKPDEKAVMFLEPAFTGKFHLVGNLHAILQLGINVPSGESFFDYQPLQTALGIQIDTGGLRTRVY